MRQASSHTRGGAAARARATARRRSRAGARAARCGGASAGARRALGSGGGMQQYAVLEAAGSSRPLRREHGAAGPAGAPNGEGGPW